VNRKKLSAIALLGLLIESLACSRVAKPQTTLKPIAFGAAVVESSGGKQIAAAGTTLPQPLVVQVNDEQGSAVTGALVQFAGPVGVSFDSAALLTDSNGQATTNVTMGGQGGRYQLMARTTKKDLNSVDVKIEEIALDYQQVLGQQLNDQYCSRCHDAESTPERVSNYDNLATKPHAFTEGDTLNNLSDAELQSIIGHGGAALNRSPLMPPYAYTLSKSDIQALISYIRIVSDPPYHAAGTVYAQK
jgi:mono/diheme cytochrome c family protein